MALFVGPAAFDDLPWEMVRTLSSHHGTCVVISSLQARQQLHISACTMIEIEPMQTPLTGNHKNFVVN